MSEAGKLNHQDRLNRAMPAANAAHLGDCLYDLINSFNALQTKYNALLAHLDGGVLGTANVSTYGTTNTVLLPDNR